MSHPIPPVVPPGAQAQLLHSVTEVAPGLMRFVLVAPPIAIQFDLPKDVMRQICAKGVEACGARIVTVSPMMPLPGSGKFV